MSTYVIEYDYREKLETGIWGPRWGVMEIAEAVGTGKAGPAFQTVYNNGKLVESVFDYRKSHFSVNENKNIFQWYPLEHNFRVLRQMCSLWDPEIEHVSSLITDFSLTDEYWVRHEVQVGDGKYKSALFLYWIAEWADGFTMDDNKRQLVWDYFGHGICADAMENQNTQHTTVRYLLNQWGSRVTIQRPKIQTNFLTKWA